MGLCSDSMDLFRIVSVVGVLWSLDPKTVVSEYGEWRMGNWSTPCILQQQQPVLGGLRALQLDRMERSSPATPIASKKTHLLSLP